MGRLGKTALNATTVSEGCTGGISVHQRYHLGQCTYDFLKQTKSFSFTRTSFLIIGLCRGNSQFFIQFCTNVTLVNSQLVPFDPGLTHTKGLRYNHPMCQALINVVFPAGLMDPYLFCCSPAVS